MLSRITDDKQQIHSCQSRLVSKTARSTKTRYHKLASRQDNVRKERWAKLKHDSKKVAIPKKKACRRQFVSCILGPRIQLSYLPTSRSSHSCLASITRPALLQKVRELMPLKQTYHLSYSQVLVDVVNCKDCKRRSVKSEHHYGKHITRCPALSTRSLRNHSLDISGFAGSQSSFTFNLRVPV